MKILFITLIPLESNESASIRNYNLIKGFVELEHSVEVLTTYKREKNSNDLPIKLHYICPQEKGKKAIELNKKVSNSNLCSLLLNFVKSIYHKLALFDSTTRFLKDIDVRMLDDNRYDVVVSSSDPVSSHIVVSKLAKQGLRWGKWIQYWGDPYIGDITKECIYPQWILRQVEMRIQKGADKIVYVSPFTLRAQKKLYPKLSQKYCFLPIPYSFNKDYCISKESYLNIGYFGAYNSKIRNIEPLYNACNRIKNKVNLFLIGDSDISFKETDNITICKRINREELQTYENKCDVFVCVLNLKGTQLPGKIYHYAGTNKPILVLVDGDEHVEKKSYLNRFNRFYIADNNEKSILAALEDLFINREKDSCISLSPYVIAKEFLE